MANRYGFEPDFENFKTALFGGRGHRVPNIELVIDREIKEGFLGRPVETLADEIAFRYEAGYDYVWISVGMVDPAGTVNTEQVREEAESERHFKGKDRRVWADEHAGVIRTREDVDAYPWPTAATADFSPFEQAADLLRPGMKAVAILGKVFTAAWQLLGFERFCELSIDQPEFVGELVRRIGESQVDVFRRALEFDSVGAVWVPDDVAYHTGPIMPPAWLAENIFPYYRTMAELCRAAGKPFIYHSDGDMNPLLDLVMDTGFDALHPIEPESMDIYALRERVGKRLCLLGNIRVHLLATAAEDQIRDLVRDRVERLGHQGAYCVGSSNSVPNYVSLKNYRAMLETSAEFGRIP